MVVSSISPVYRSCRAWLKQDFERVDQALRGSERVFEGTRVLVTGAAGFLGFNFLHYFSYLNERLAKPMTIIAADSYLRGQPRWISELVGYDPSITVRRCSVTEPWPDDEEFDYIVHGASIASPMVYRRYPLETLDTNVNGLRHMLELARRSQSRSILYFSSSEIYGDPSADQVPTPEAYRGNVACIGPRACYDESKRLGETLCYLYARQFDVPSKIVRPFNNYGPGLRLTDGRVIPDLCRDLLADRDLVLYSDGGPTRTFCYVSDALTGYLLTLLSTHHGEPFNIGTDAPEISIHDLASLLVEIAGSRRRVIRQVNQESDYLTDNPTRRCPKLEKARRLLGYEPQVELKTGLERTIDWYRQFRALEEICDPVTSA